MSLYNIRSPSPYPLKHDSHWLNEPAITQFSISQLNNRMRCYNKGLTFTVGQIVKLKLVLIVFFLIGPGRITAYNINLHILLEVPLVSWWPTSVGINRLLTRGVTETEQTRRSHLKTLFIEANETSIHWLV